MSKSNKNTGDEKNQYLLVLLLLLTLIASSPLEISMLQRHVMSEIDVTQMDRTHVSSSSAGLMDLDLAMGRARGRMLVLEVESSKGVPNKVIKSYLATLFKLIVSSSESAADLALPATGRGRERERSPTLNWREKENIKNCRNREHEKYTF